MRVGLLPIAAGVAMLALAAGPVEAYEQVDVAGAGTVSGVVKFSGTAPARAKITIDKDTEVCGKEENLSEDLVVGAGGGIQNAVVYLSGVTKGKAWPEDTAVLDQNGCRFIPHVALAQPDTGMDVLNNDGILHNLHSYSEKNRSFNIAQPKFKKKITRKFAEPEFIKVTCDVHRWMKGYVVVRDSPYYVVTDEKGAFELKDVPPGDYELKVWHETLGEKSQQVSVGPQGQVAASFELAKN